MLERHLLGQEFIEPQSIPLTAFGPQDGLAGASVRLARRKSVQPVDRLGQRREPQFPQRLRREPFLGQVGLQCTGHMATDHRLGEPLGGRIDRQQGLRLESLRREPARPNLGVNELQPRQRSARLPQHTNLAARREGLQHALVEVNETQTGLARVVFNTDHQRSARLEDHLGEHHSHLHLHRLSRSHLGQRPHLRLVLVTKRQVEQQVDGAHEPQLAQAFRPRGSACGHGLISLAGPTPPRPRRQHPGADLPPRPPHVRDTAA